MDVKWANREAGEKGTALDMLEDPICKSGTGVEVVEQEEESNATRLAVGVCTADLP